MKRIAIVVMLMFLAGGSLAITGGRAKGTLTIIQDEVQLTHGYVIEVGSERRIVVADSEIEEIAADAENTYLPAGVQGVVLVLDDAGLAKEAFFIQSAIPGLSVRETPRFEVKKSKKGTLAGRVVMDEPGNSFGFDATFEAPIVKVEAQPMPQKPDPVTGMSDEERNGALVTAVDRGDVAEAKRLIEAGANVNQIGPYRQSLVMSAGTNAEMIKLLAEAGADVNTPNEWLMTPLIVVAEQGSMEAVKTLLDAGAKINARNTSGLTAIGIAATRGYRDLVAFLLEQGADVKRDTAELLEYANEYPEIQEMIRAAAKK